MSIEEGRLMYISIGIYCCELSTQMYCVILHIVL